MLCIRQTLYKHKVSKPSSERPNNPSTINSLDCINKTVDPPQMHNWGSWSSRSNLEAKSLSRPWLHSRQDKPRKPSHAKPLEPFVPPFFYSEVKKSSFPFSLEQASERARGRKRMSSFIWKLSPNAKKHWERERHNLSLLLFVHCKCCFANSCMPLEGLYRSLSS